MNLDAHLVREPFPNYETITAIQEVEYGKGTKARDSNDLFNKLIYFKNRTTPLRSVR